MPKPKPAYKLDRLYKHTTGGKTQIWDIWVEPLPDGTAKMVTRYGLEEGKQQTIEEIIREGKNTGRRNATTPLEQARAEATSRWNKQKDRKGYGLDVQQSAVVRSVSPMLAHVFEKHKRKVTWDNAFAQPKLDGFRCLARVGRDGSISLRSRENQPFKVLGHIQEALAEVLAGGHFHWHDDEPDAAILDGELYVPGMALREISSACKRKSALTEKLQYHVYDAAVPGKFEDRSIFARQFVTAGNANILIPVDTVKVRSEGELLHAQAAFMEEGYEGAMLRHGLHGYEAGRRSANLLKVKTFQDAEFKIVDYKFGRGKYEGVPVFVCETEDGHPFDVLAPGTMDEKRALGVHAQHCIGRRLTVKYQYLTTTDTPVPFLPVAKAFRT